MEQSKGSVFLIRLSDAEKKGYCYEEYAVELADLSRPVHIKDEGDFLSVWGRYGRIDMPVRFLGPLRRFLRTNGVAFQDEFGEAGLRVPEQARG